MNYYDLEIGSLKRRLPILKVSPKTKIASFNLLGDRELVVNLAEDMASKIKGLDFDYLVGPEVKVVPLLHELSGILKKKRYVVCRKGIHGYMVSPVATGGKPALVLNGEDAKRLKKKRVVVIDDVVSSGRTLRAVAELMEMAEAKIVSYVTIFKQGELPAREIKGLIYLGTLPLFRDT